MNKQEIFNKVVEGLASQDFRRSMARDPDGSDDSSAPCAYRGAKGFKCAIGHLIPDEAYDPRWEGIEIALLLKRPSSDMRNVLSRLGIELSEDAKEFLTELQNAHDGFRYPGKDDDMSAGLLAFARNHDLEIPRVLLR